MRNNRVVWVAAVVLSAVGCSDGGQVASEEREGAFGSSSTSAGSEEGSSGDTGDVCLLPEPVDLSCALPDAQEPDDDDEDPFDDWGGKPDLGAGSTGGDSCPPPPEEPLGECCITECSIGTPPPGPLPSKDPSTFNCPVAKMRPYYSMTPNQSWSACGWTPFHFDCDDFAYACENWAIANGIKACTYTFGWRMPDGTKSGHAINIIQVRDDSGPLDRWCLIEPQSNHNYGCWYQPAGEEPKVPGWLRNQLCQLYGAKSGECNCWEIETSCGGDYVGDEKCFTEFEEACQRFENVTGICTDTWEPPTSP